MLTAEKTELLQSFLGSLPGQIAARLAKAVEVDRLVDGAALPHDLILDGLRPTLRGAQAQPRTPTPLRLFCRPFEDLLINGPRNDKQKGRIARSSIVPIWAWLQALIPEEWNSYRAGIKELVLAYKMDDALACACKFWPLAGQAMSTAIANNPKGVRTALNGELALGDAEDIARMLCAGTAMMEIQQLLPKPAPALTDDLLWSLRGIYDGVVETAVDSAPYVPVVVMGRLAKPWEALKLALMISHQTQDTLIASTDMGLVGDILFSRMEDARIAIHATRQSGFDAVTLLENLKFFTDISSAIVKEVEILRRGKWGKRLLGDRAAVGAVMDGFMERAPKEIAAALPSQKTGYSGSGRMPDFTKKADPEKIERALRYAKLLAGCRSLAVPGSFGAKHAKAVDEATLVMRSYNEDLVKELRSAEGARRENVERQFQLCTELTGMVFSEEEAEFLRRRGKAAIAKQSAA